MKRFTGIGLLRNGGQPRRRRRALAQPAYDLLLAGGSRLRRERQPRRPGGHRHPGRRGGGDRPPRREGRSRCRAHHRSDRPLPRPRLGGPPLPRRPVARRRQHGRAEGGEPGRPGDHYRGDGSGRAEPRLADSGRNRRLREPRGGPQRGSRGGSLDGSSPGDGSRPRAARHRRRSRPDGGTGARRHGRRRLGPRGGPRVPPGTLLGDRRDHRARATWSPTTTGSTTRTSAASRRCRAGRSRASWTGRP